MKKSVAILIFNYEKNIERTLKAVYGWADEIVMIDNFRKFQIYTSEGAETRFKKGKKATFLKIVLNPCFRFVKRYIFQLGFLDWFYGFMDTAFSSIYIFTIYSKLRLLEINSK